MRRAGRGFSLIELLVVIGIIAILIGILLPSLSRSWEAARTVQCASQLSQLGTGFFNYAANNNGHLPAWSGWHNVGGNGTGDDDPGPGWMEEIASTYSNPRSPVYDCPAFPPGNPMNYFIAARWLKLNGRQSWILSDIKDSSEFVLSGDTTHGHLYPPPFGYAPHVNPDCDKDDAVGPAIVFFGEDDGFNVHRAGNNVLFADRHVAAFKRFDPNYMTFSPHNHGQSWDDVTAD